MSSGCRIWAQSSTQLRSRCMRCGSWHVSPPPRQQRWYRRIASSVADRSPVGPQELGTRRCTDLCRCRDLENRYLRSMSIAEKRLQMLARGSVGAGRSHVDLGAEPQPGGATGVVEIEHDPLPGVAACGTASARERRRRCRSRPGRCRTSRHRSPTRGSYAFTTPCMIGDTTATARHRTNADRVALGRTGGVQPALTTLPALMQLVHTFRRLGAPSTWARTRWMFRVPAALGAPVRVRHLHAPRRTLAAHFTTRCH